MPDLLRSPPHPLLLLVLGSGLLPAQQPMVAPRSPAPGRGPALVTLATAAANEAVGTSAPWQHGLIPTRDGSLFALVVRTRWRDAARTGEPSSDLELWRSRDRGLSWQHATSAPTHNDADGTLVPDGDGLALAWTSRDGKPWCSVFAQRYDPRQDAWLGKPARLAEGTGERDQYFATDLERTSQGALVAAIGCHGSPPAPAWNCGWSTGLSWLLPGAAAWTAVAQTNVSSYGCCGTLAARGNLVDVTYRTCPNEAIHGLRTLDLTTGQYLQATEDCAMAGPREDHYIANVGVLAVDGTGARTILHLLGDHSPGKGRLALSYGKVGEDWVTTDLADDPPLFAGNENPQHYALARGPANQLHAYWSKASEQFADLWTCAIEDGKPVGAPRVVAKGTPNSFLVLSGNRTPQAFSSAHVVTRGTPAEHPGGIVSVYGTWPAPTAWVRQP